MIRKMTPTGFSIKGISAIITAQDPNIDPSDAKSIAEEIRFNLLSSVFGDSKTTSIRSPVRKATSASSAVSKKEEAKQNKLVISELKEIKKSGGAQIRDLTVFDIYEGDKLAQGQKSVALRATFQGSTEALTEDNIQQLSQKTTPLQSWHLQP